MAGVHSLAIDSHHLVAFPESGCVGWAAGEDARSPGGTRSDQHAVVRGKMLVGSDLPRHQ